MRSFSGMHFRHWVFTIVAASALLTSCGRSNVSGTYIAKFTNGVEMLQLVETPDHHVTGQQLGVLLNKEGKIENINATVTGAVDRSNISLIIKPTFFLSEEITESGTFDSAKISLTGKLSNPEPSTVVFERSNAEEFETLAKAVNDRSQQLLAAKAEAEAQQRQARAETLAREQAAQHEREVIDALNGLTQRMGRFDAYVDGILDKVPKVEQHYRAITAQMNTYLQRERGLAGNPNAAGARGQLSAALNQGLIAGEQLHNSVQPTQWDFENNAQPFMRQVTAAEKACDMNKGVADGDETDARQDACHKLLGAASHFKEQFQALTTNLARLEDVYRKEHTTQAQLVSEAGRIE